MSNKNKTSKRPETATLKEVRRAPDTADGREKWYVSTAGRMRTVTTSVTSSQAINEAMEVYSDALKRLAKR